MEFLEKNVLTSHFFKIVKKFIIFKNIDILKVKIQILHFCTKVYHRTKFKPKKCKIKTYAREKKFINDLNQEIETNNL